MRSSRHGIPSHLPNAFDSNFLKRFEQRDEPPTGFALALDDGIVLGRCEVFDPALAEALNVVVAVVRSPWCLAYLLEAAGPLALERCGAILERWIAREGGAL